MPQGRQSSREASEKETQLLLRAKSGKQRAGEKARETGEAACYKACIVSGCQWKEQWEYNTCE